MNRQKSIKVRLTESEYELLKKQANGSPMASYMRSVCLGNSQTPSKNTPNIHPQLGVTPEFGENSTLRNLVEYF